MGTKSIALMAVGGVVALALGIIVGIGASSLLGSTPSKSVVANQAATMTVTSDASQSSATANTSASAETSSTTTTNAAAANNAASASQSTPTSGKLSGFVALSQDPLPTGCEITSLAATLNYLGFDIDKQTLANNYLAKGPVGSTNPYNAFVGDPSDSSSYGCYAPVIVNAANSYLSSQGSSLQAKNLTGASLQSLYSYIDQGTPVIVWGTQYCNPAQKTVTWTFSDGSSFTWTYPEHCMVLVGYDTTAGTVSVADPLEGAVVNYTIDEFQTAYSALYSQAVVIQ